MACCGNQVEPSPVSTPVGGAFEAANEEAFEKTLSGRRNGQRLESGGTIYKGLVQLLLVAGRTVAANNCADLDSPIVLGTPQTPAPEMTNSDFEQYIGTTRLSASQCNRCESLV
jgi:hypothetical protein